MSELGDDPLYRNPAFSAPKSRRRDDNPRDLNHPELVVDEWLRDWHGAAWTPDAKEIIPVGRLG